VWIKLCRTFPCFSIDGQMIVTEFKYLGHISSAKMQDDCDIAREVRSHKYVSTAF